MGAVSGEIRDRFFDKYVSSKKKSGTGLGAYSARLMAETQNGTIAMKTSEREGTTITVHLPLPSENEVNSIKALLVFVLLEYAFDSFFQFFFCIFKGFGTFL